MLKVIKSKTARFDVRNHVFPSECIEYTQKVLTEIKADKKLANKALLMLEETLVSFIENAADDAQVKIKVVSKWGEAIIKLEMKGDEFDPLNSDYSEVIVDDESGEVSEEKAIRAILFRAYGEKFSYTHKKGTNRAKISLGQSDHYALYITLAALGLGILFGLLMKNVIPDNVSSAIGEYALDPVKKMFMNALKIIIAPVVFFSIVTCISQFKNLSELGKIGAKVMGTYLMTTVIAVLLGIATFSVIQPGEVGFALSSAGEGALTSVDLDTNVDTSLLHTIMNIVPSNFLKPFLESDTLQIIFLAVICGIALGKLEEYSAVLKKFFDACNSLFLAITTIITKFIPLAVFCSVSMMIVNMSADSLLSVMGVAGTQILTIMEMILIYGLLVFLFTRLSPIRFYKNVKEGMLTSFSLSSSSAAMPTNLRVCKEKLGIHPKVCNFSIPLGATVNMDGTCVFLSVIALSLARAYGVEISLEMLISVSLTIVLLSLGAPGVPGSAIVCLGIVLQQMNVPVEAMSLIIAVSPIMDMFDTMSNTTGDMAASLIAAKSEGLIDTDIYYGRKSKSE